MGGVVWGCHFFATATSHGIVGVLGLFWFACTYACVVVHEAMPVWLYMVGLCILFAWRAFLLLQLWDN